MYGFLYIYERNIYMKGNNVNKREEIKKKNL